MNDFKIAGLKKVSQWKTLAEKLALQPSEDLWNQAFQEYLVTRIKTRYYDPIEAITKIPEKQGKGFSIITIYCSLIEFFETQLKGYYFENRNYRDNSSNIVKSKTKKDNQGIFKPISTEDIFVQFLTENEPFKSNFTDLIAKEFYFNVRCAILHQAETSANWIVREGKVNESIILVDSTKNIIYWKPLHQCFDLFLKSYGNLLKTDKDIQKNFLFKWNKIANLL